MTVSNTKTTAGIVMISMPAVFIRKADEDRTECFPLSFMV